jgi:hypothetical protein
MTNWRRAMIGPRRASRTERRSMSKRVRMQHYGPQSGSKPLSPPIARRLSLCLPVVPFVHGTRY